MTTVTCSHEDGIITVSPVGKIYFGVISNGFIYRLEFHVRNNLLMPIKVRVHTNPVDPNEQNLLRLLEMPSKVAPGMMLKLQLELTADHVATSYFTLQISQDKSDEIMTKMVEANIVSIDTFKHVKKSLQLQNRPVYRANVEVVGNTPEFEDKMTASLIASIASNSSLVMMDDDEIEDMMDFPIAPNAYWDPFSKCMRIDPELGKAYADGQMKMKKATKKTEARRNRRLKQLEEQGFFTESTLKMMRGDRFGSSSMFSHHVHEVEDENGEEDPANGDNEEGSTAFSSASTAESSTIMEDGKKALSDSESDGEGDLLSELVKTGTKEVMMLHQQALQNMSQGLESPDRSLMSPDKSTVNTARTSESTGTERRMSVTGILAMRRVRVLRCWFHLNELLARKPLIQYTPPPCTGDKRKSGETAAIQCRRFLGLRPGKCYEQCNRQ